LGKEKKPEKIFALPISRDRRGRKRQQREKDYARITQKVRAAAAKKGKNQK